jgi:hypothetical protein
MFNTNPMKIFIDIQTDNMHKHKWPCNYYIQPSLFFSLISPFSHWPLIQLSNVVAMVLIVATSHTLTIKHVYHYSSTTILYTQFQWGCPTNCHKHDNSWPHANIQMPKVWDGNLLNRSNVICVHHIGSLENEISNT